MPKKGTARRLVDLDPQPIYQWVRGFSQRLMRLERKSHTLEPTALANEVMARLYQWDGPIAGEDNEKQQASLRLLAATIARQVLLDHARRRLRAKRGGDFRRVPLESVDEPEKHSRQIVELELALQDFEELYPEEAQLVQLRFYGGASMTEAAEFLGWSERTTARRWAFAKAWLQASCEDDFDVDQGEH